MERTFSYAASAVSARFFVDLDLSINDLCNFVWTRGFDRTLFAAFADICVDFRDPLSDNPDIIQIRFDTVVRTAAYCDLEFVWQCDIAVSFWQVVPLQDTTGRTFAPVPPVTSPSFAMNCWNSSILS